MNTCTEHCTDNWEQAEAAAKLVLGEPIVAAHRASAAASRTRRAN